MSEREEIRKRAEERRHHAYEELLAYKNSEAYELFRQAEVDLDALLERVEELEAEIERLESEVRKRDELLERMA